MLQCIIDGNPFVRNSECSTFRDCSCRWKILYQYLKHRIAISSFHAHNPYFSSISSQLSLWQIYNRYFHNDKHQNYHFVKHIINIIIMSSSTKIIFFIQRQRKCFYHLFFIQRRSKELLLSLQCLHNNSLGVSRGESACKAFWIV